MTFRRIEFGSADFEMECELRDRVLRAPLGMSLRDEDLAAEEKQVHFGLFDEKGVELRACVIVVPLSATSVKIRQMAVSESHQNQGCGRLIMACVDEYLAETRHSHASLHARASAVGFYEKLGFTRIGDEFIEIGLRHFMMEKHLNPE